MRTPLTADWPPDPDGRVLRGLAESHFDFSSEHEIDFNVDFQSWPTGRAALAWLRKNFLVVETYEPSGTYNGYVLVKATAKLTYDFVFSTQQRVSDAMNPYGGVCESWGVSQTPAQ